MCTAVTYYGQSRCFGRNLDLDSPCGAQVVLTPRDFPLPFRTLPAQAHHYAMLGMARVEGDYPLYFDAMNERGLAMAGLNFPGHAAYYPYRTGADNVTPFELIPWVLGQCADLEQTKTLLDGLNLLAQDFSPELPLTPLHWMVADGTGALVIEPLEDGLHILNAPVGTLTNAPPFAQQMERLNRMPAEATLPGDLSSPSRFLRAAFFRRHSPVGLPADESVSQLFHILGSAAQPKGAGRLPDGREEHTVYTACCDLSRGIYSYTTYENSRPTAVEIRREALDGGTLTIRPLRQTPDVFWT